MIRTLLTTLCLLPQEHEQDMGLGPSETGAHSRLVGSVGARGSMARQEVWSPVPMRWWSWACQAMGRQGRKGTQRSIAWIGIRTVPAVGNRDGLFGLALQGLITSLCALKAALKESPLHSWKHMQLLLLLVVEGANSDIVYGRKSIDFSRFSSLAKKIGFWISANTPVKRERVQIRPKGTGEFVDPHTNNCKKLVLFMVEWIWQ